MYFDSTVIVLYCDSTVTVLYYFDIPLQMYLYLYKHLFCFLGMKSSSGIGIFCELICNEFFPP